MRLVWIISLFVLLSSKSLFANPLPEFLPPVISELYFDSTGWHIELYITGDNYFSNLNGCCLMTNSGQAYFNSGITSPYEEVILINQSHLQDSLFINPEGDYLRFFDTYGYLSGSEYGDFFKYGPWSDYVSAPQEGESIAYFSDEYGIEPWEVTFILAKNCPPTLGYDPFEVNGHGSFHGYVFDINQYPLPGAYVQYGGITDDSGYFFQQSLLCRKYWQLDVIFEGTAVAFYNLVIEPNDTAFIEINTNVNLSTIEKYSNHNISFFSFPNPFSGQTRFKIENLPDNNSQEMEIVIRNSKGSVVNRLPVKPKSSEILWNSLNLTSGIYYVSLVRDKEVVQTQKLIKL